MGKCIVLALPLYIQCFFFSICSLHMFGISQVLTQNQLFLNLSVWLLLPVLKLNTDCLLVRLNWTQWTGRTLDQLEDCILVCLNSTQWISRTFTILDSCVILFAMEFFGESQHGLSSFIWIDISVKVTINCALSFMIIVLH